MQLISRIVSIVVLVFRRGWVMTKSGLSTLAVAVALALASGTGSAQFLGNFDAVNTTGKTARGFEIELEGLSSSDISDTFGGANRGFPTTVERYGAPETVPYATGVSVIYEATYVNGDWMTLEEPLSVR